MKANWLPAKNQESKRTLIVLHGRGDSPAGFQWLPPALQFEDLNYLFLQAPDAYYTGYSWYDFPPNQEPGVLRSRALLDQMMEQLKVQGMRAEDIALFGFSQGCLMILEWAGRSRELFAGSLCISGYAFDVEKLAAELTPEAKSRAWLMTHGTEDGVLYFQRTAEQVAQLKAAGLPIDFHAIPKDHTIDDVWEIPLFKQWLKDRWPGLK